LGFLAVFPKSTRVSSSLGPFGLCVVSDRCQGCAVRRQRPSTAHCSGAPFLHAPRPYLPLWALKTASLSSAQNNIPSFPFFLTAMPSPYMTISNCCRGRGHGRVSYHRLTIAFPAHYPFAVFRWQSRRASCSLLSRFSFMMGPSPCHPQPDLHCITDLVRPPAGFRPVPSRAALHISAIRSRFRSEPEPHDWDYMSSFLLRDHVARLMVDRPLPCARASFFSKQCSRCALAQAAAPFHARAGFI